ncbi:MAG: tRNA-binding protein [Bacteroidetes bacterium]|nr:tRNA-binding protein [Bacteroidota bacterium]
METKTIDWSDFEKIDIRVGTFQQAGVFEEAKKPAYKLLIDLGELGKRKSSAQITKLYKTEDLIGKQIMSVINFSPKQIANMQSECLILGVIDGDVVTLLTSDKPVKNGLRIA